MRPEQKRAYDMVRAAKHKGLIVPPAECNRCKEPTRYGKDGRSLLHGHHHDYSKPLDVEWICVKCHRIETRCPKGEEHCRSKLTSKLVQAAILLNDSGFLLTDIADFYGLSRQAVSHAVTGKNWKEEREK